MNRHVALIFAALFAISTSEVLRAFPQNVDLTPCDSHPLCHYKGYGNWRHLGRAESSKEHTVVIAVKLAENAAQSCDSLLMEISNPASSTYGNHLNLQEVSDLTSNTVASRAVLQWLNQFDLTEVDAGVTSDFITVKAPISVLEQMLQTELHVFEHVRGRTIIRAASYSLPEMIAQHVEFILNVVDLPRLDKTKVKITATAGGDGFVDPFFLQQFYNINVKKSSKKSSQSVFETLGQDYSPSDLFTFQSTFNVPGVQPDQVIGPNNPSACPSNFDTCAEANLDVQYIMAIAPGANMTYWSIDDSKVDDPFYAWIIALSQDSKPPLVHSISYGSVATEEDATEAIRFNTEVCKLSLRGVTIVVSSGDDGVANYEARENKKKCGFAPSFPATSPYVVAVGATSGPESNKPEVACSAANGDVITTGGGFSYYFPRPSYQDDVVSNYLKNGPNVPPLNLFNNTGRGYPDVALLGFNYQVIIATETFALAGTSASAPVFAGMLTLINDMRIAKGKSPVGFVNPALYSIAAQDGQNSFNDITSGENNCCAEDSVGGVNCCKYGFTASTGWDPLTGLGSVNFKNLANNLVNM